MKEILEKYTIVGNTTGQHSVGEFGTIDFDTLTLAEADLLFKGGCEVFKLKTEPKPVKPEK
jgi:hypothetical protein